MQRKITRRLNAALLCGAALCAAPLQAQTVRSGVEISTSAEATSNPYLDTNSDKFVGAGAVEVRPWVQRTTQTDQVELEAFVRLRAFTSEFDLEDSYGGNLRASSRLNARTTAYGSLGVLSTTARNRLNGFDRVPGVADPINPETPIPDFPIGDDLSLLGLPGRTTSINLLAGIDRVLDERSSAGANIAYQKVIADNGLGADYDNISLGASYSHRLTDRTSVGLNANVSRARYDGEFPDSTTVSANASIDHQAGQYWFLAASAGLATTRTDSSVFGPADAGLYAVGSASGCYRRPDQSFCLSASRAQQPSVLGGTRAQTSIGFNMNQRLSARDRFDASANYTRSGDPQGVSLTDRSIELVSLRATLTRSFSDRLDGYIFASGSRVYDDGAFANRLGNGANLSFGAGVRVRLGSIR